LDEQGDVMVSRVLVGGAAYRCGVLSPGCIIHKINDQDVHGFNVDQIADLMVYMCLSTS